VGKRRWDTVPLASGKILPRARRLLVARRSEPGLRKGEAASRGTMVHDVKYHMHFQGIFALRAGGHHLDP
jgi:hypothetical protein